MTDRAAPARLVVALSGASGVIYGVRLLERLREVPAIETHLVVSPDTRRTLEYETDLATSYVDGLADATYGFKDLAAAISSGSFTTSGMIVAPCSVKTLSGIASSYDDNLIVRAADVTLKERRRLVLLFRETPLHLGHLRLLVQVTEIGAIVMPPVPAFYSRPATLDDIIDQTVGRALDLCGIEVGGFARWDGGDRSQRAPVATEDGG